jgi:branched-chain amino acid transport system permease protein
MLRSLSTRLLSADLPRSRPLSAVLLAIVFALAFAPFIFPGTVAYRTYSNICIFLILAASYDMLLGYASIVSFAHGMFFGIGAYGVAIALQRMGASWTAVAVGLAIALLLCTALALLISLLSLRVKSLFFAMVTLAVASAFSITVSKLYSITGGEDGLTLNLPDAISPLTRGPQVHGVDLAGLIGRLFGGRARSPWFSFHLGGDTVLYYGIFFSAAVLFLLMLRVVNSPFGLVLKAMRENAFRAEAMGYRTIRYFTLDICLAAAMACFAGALYALSQQYVSVGQTLSFDVMIDILLMTVIGGMGTLYGAIVGSALLGVASGYLQALLSLAHASMLGSIPVMGGLMSGERWPFWLGLLFVLSVYFFPRGIVGQLRAWAERR